MAKVTLLVVPRAVLFSGDPLGLIAFLVATVKNPEDRIPPYLEWSYIFSHDITSAEMELLVQG